MATGSAMPEPPSGPESGPQVLDLFPRGDAGDPAGSSVRPPRVETGKDIEDTGGPGGPPRAPPGQSKPWRKSWKRKYRDGSSYRKLNLLQREILRYIEDNADDQGVCEVSNHRLAAIVSSPQQVISRATVQSALKSLAQRGHLEFIKDIIKDFINPTQAYRRVNYQEFQESKPEVAKDIIKDFITLAEGSTDKKIPSPTQKRRRVARDPSFDALLDALRQQYLAIKGEPLDVPVHHRGDLLAIRKIIGDDAELKRRWREFLTDQFYPTKNLKAFRVAHPKYAATKPKPITLRPVPGIDTDE